jgi:hypothetical protein
MGTRPNKESGFRECNDDLIAAVPGAVKVGHPLWTARRLQAASLGQLPQGLSTIE